MYKIKLFITTFTFLFLTIIGLRSATPPNLNWYIINNFGKSIYPSYEVSTATLSPTQKAKSDFQSLLVRIDVPKPGTIIDIKINSNKFIKNSVTHVVCSRSGKQIIPLVLNWDFDSLLAVIETRPESFHYELSVNEVYVDSRDLTYQVQSINDCLYTYTLPLNKKVIDTHFLFASYVDENNPTIDRILHRVLELKLLKQVSYTDNPTILIKEMSAIWDVVQSLGIKYSSITTPSVSNAAVYSQHIRFFNDSLTNSEANCVDGSVLFASIFRKANLGSPFLVLIPGHCYLGVEYNSKTHESLYIETTTIGNNANFEYALSVGSREYKRDSSYFNSHDPRYNLVNIKMWRSSGINSLPASKESTPVLNFGLLRVDKRQKSVTDIN